MTTTPNQKYFFFSRGKLFYFGISNRLCHLRLNPPRINHRFLLESIIDSSPVSAIDTPLIYHRFFFACTNEKNRKCQFYMCLPAFVIDSSQYLPSIPSRICHRFFLASAIDISSYLLLISPCIYHRLLPLSTIDSYLYFSLFLLYYTLAHPQYIFVLPFGEVLTSRICLKYNDSKIKQFELLQIPI